MVVPVSIKMHRQNKSMLMNSDGTVPFSFCVTVLLHLVTLIPSLFSSLLFLWYDHQDQALHFAVAESQVFFQEWRVIWVPALGFQRQSSLFMMSWAGPLVPLIIFEILILYSSTQWKKMYITVYSWTYMNSVRWGILQANLCSHIYV